MGDDAEKPLACSGTALAMGDAKVNVPLLLPLLLPGLFTGLAAVFISEPPELLELVTGARPKLNVGATTGSVNSVDSAGASTCSRFE